MKYSWDDGVRLRVTKWVIFCERHKRMIPNSKKFAKKISFSDEQTESRNRGVIYHVEENKAAVFVW